MDSISSMLNEIKSALFSANAESDKRVVVSGIKKCNHAIRVINELLKKSLNVSQKQMITTAIGQVRSFKQMFEAIQIIGFGYESRKQTARDRVRWADVESAFKKRIKTGVITNLKHTDPKKFLDDAFSIFRVRISSYLKNEESFKVNVVFCGEFIKKMADQEVRELKYFNTKNAPIYRDTDLQLWFTDNVQAPILTHLEEFQEKESGWALSAIINLQVNINKFTPQLGSSYIELPPQIASKKACVNVKNDDNKCFAWAVTSALYPAKKSSDRTSSYPNPSAVLNMTGIQFPMTTKQISRFEAQNSISINVYILKKYKKKMITLPTYLTKSKQEKHINLLLIQDVYIEDDFDMDTNDDDNNNTLMATPKYHYVWIKNLSRLLCAQLSKHDGKKYFCDRCLHYFYTETKRDAHYEDCKEMNDCKIRLPTEFNNLIHFKNFKNKVKAPFIVYADLECLLIPSKEKNKYQEHHPCSIAYYVKCTYDDSLSFYRSYRGNDCISWFTHELESFAEDLETVFLCPLPMDTLTPDEQINYDNAIVCHICKKEFTGEHKKVRDHDHLTGKYRGPAHEECNINFKDSHTVPIIFHNLSGYDTHFIIKNLANDIKGRLDVLPITKEKYISFTKHLSKNLIKYRFIDSFRFMASSLDSLSSFLKEYPILTSQFPELDESNLNLLTRKGVYPYDYFDSSEKFYETELPTQSKFYNKLTEQEITDEDYAHAQRIWKEFECRNLGEYSDLYLKTDVLLLADIFEQFRYSCLNTYDLDPAHYYTLPGYAYDCMLKETGIVMELLTDIDMIMFIERGIRGGLSQCSLRYAKANNKYCTSDYDPSKPNKFLLYTDINNQYGWAMSQYLPYGGFKWLSEDESKTFDVMCISNTSDKGYILEVDLEYPEELHDLHNDLPFCPEHRSASNLKEKKLMATLYDKRRYVVHYQNLKQTLNHGLKLKKVHRILEFKQSTWLKSYIDLNTELRKNAKNEFEKNLFKLMNNAVFGKTLENIRNHSIVKLVTKWHGRYAAESLISKPEFKNLTIFDENLVAIELNKSEIFFNKPIYVGMAILDISKTKIYEFHYDYMKPQFGEKCRAAYTDTDSIIYEVECSDIYDVIRLDCHTHFDTSDYASNNIYNIPQVNKKVLGMMKDEMHGRIMTEFVGLRSKMYALRVEDKDAMRKAKGIKKYVVKNRITFDDYIECLNDSNEKSVEQNLIKSNKHVVSSITNRKIALSPFDDKRYIIPGTYQTLAWGHYSIMETSPT